MRTLLLAIFIFSSNILLAQVGINTTTPNAQLDIKSSSQVAPSNTDGVLIPKIDVFPAINPTAAQQGMLVYLTTATTFSGNPKPIGFYYWDNSPADWIAVKGTDGGTLDQAYDFGGAGAGKTITADTGAVTINGTDGLVSTGTLNSGAVAPSGAGVKMFWNPRKAAFRAGNINGTQWDDTNIGNNSISFGLSNTSSGNTSTTLGFNNTASGPTSISYGFSTIASGNTATSFGFSTNASGPTATAFGFLTIASNNTATSFGNLTSASGLVSTSFGDNTIASGSRSTAFGAYNSSSTYGETVLGIGATTYTPSANGTTQFRAANSTDRLFVLGNAIDVDNDNVVDDAERSDALVILKNGNTGLGSSNPADKLHVVGNIRMVDGNQAAGNVLTSDANGTATWTAPGAGTAGTLDQSYDFGGAGLGRTITADTGAVTINGTDGLVSTGTINSGVIAPSGAGTRMVWNPRKAAFRAGQVFANQWDDANIGLSSVAMGHVCLASGFAATAIGDFVSALGLGSTAFGISSTAFGRASTVFGQSNFANSSVSTAIGFSNTAYSYGETVLGIGATIYAPSINGATQFGAANVTDRLFVIGNAIDANNTGFVELTERSDALVVLKNGNIGIGSSTPQDKLHILGNLRMVDGNQAARKVLTSDANGTASWQNASTNAWGLIGNSGMNPATNFVGTTDAQPLRFRAANTFAGNISNTTTGLVSLGFNAGPGNTGLANTFIGGTAGVLNTSGASNTFIGQGAGAANATSSFNTYVGTGAGQSNATGSQNVYIGRLAGASGNTGSDNILIGNGAGFLNTANNNIMIGSFAGNVNSTGGGNTFMGTLAGNTTSTGGQNTFIGTGAGSTNSTGTQNTLIGNGAAVNANNLINATAIGRGSRVDVNDGLVLGSVSGINAATSTSLVGIGTTAPLERLHVAGKAFLTDGFSADNAAIVYKNNTDYMFLGPQSGSSANGGAMALFGNTNVSGGNAGGIDLNVLSGQLRITSAGNVGIGTTPTRKFHVSNGSSGGTPNGNAGIVLESSTNVYQHFLNPNFSESGLLFGSNSASIHGGIIFDNSDQDITFRSGGNISRVVITNAGYMGIGALVPGGQLELSLNEGRKPASNVWTIPSDARLKNVNGIYQKGLAEILQLKPIRYNYKNTDKRTFDPKVLDKEAFGFLAQEVQPLFPEAVGTDPDGYLNFDLHPILIASINALKELNAKNEQLEQKSSQLEKENQLLKESVQAINDKMLLIIAEMEKLKK